jgi:hypothetical protein
MKTQKYLNKLDELRSHIARTAKLNVLGGNCFVGLQLQVAILEVVHMHPDRTANFEGAGIYHHGPRGRPSAAPEVLQAGFLPGNCDIVGVFVLCVDAPCGLLTGIAGSDVAVHCSLQTGAHHFVCFKLTGRSGCIVAGSLLAMK